MDIISIYVNVKQFSGSLNNKIEALSNHIRQAARLDIKPIAHYSLRFRQPEINLNTTRFGDIFRLFRGIKPRT